MCSMVLEHEPSGGHITVHLPTCKQHRASQPVHVHCNGVCECAETVRAHWECLLQTNVTSIYYNTFSTHALFSRIPRRGQCNEQNHILPRHSRHAPACRGNGIASRIFDRPVKYCTTRSNPIPNPAWGTDPNFRKSAYQASVPSSVPPRAR